ncbi:MAG: RnfABCDGE type electron transport complex subunit B [Pseudomonadota bacterium]|nr:RnfABCDGE type electron transport complex subunit B [Pseudomonadota bacterium]
MGTESASDVVRHIDALLPQTQCTRCGYPGCLPYAAAVAGGEAQINQCPPGGSATIRALARLLDRAFLPLNPTNGVETAPQVAWIDESRCIGCARCLPPCPVDAIVGAAKFMHTVLAERCTGCELCLAPCPVDCIEMRPGPAPAANHAALNRARHEAHTRRLLRRAAERQRELAAKKASVSQGVADAPRSASTPLASTASASTASSGPRTAGPR